MGRIVPARLHYDLAVLQEHRDRLPVLWAAILDDLAEFEARIAEVERNAEDTVDDAREELTRLRSLQDEDSSLVSDEDIEAAEDHYHASKRYADRISERVAHARRKLRETEESLDNLYPAATLEFDTKLDQYQRLHAFGIGTGGQINAATGVTSVRMRGAGARNGSAVRSTLGPLPVLPNGLVWVPIEQLDWDQVPSNLPFAKASRDSMEAMLSLFAGEVMPMMRGPGGVTRDYLYRLDQRLGNGGGAGSLTFAWDCMVGGSEPITLNRPHQLTGPKYGWTYGRHRALLAKSLGWTHVPARVI